MTIAIKHAFVSLKGDGTDTTQVQPSNWNAAHALTLASGNLVGRLSAGAGNAEEIPISAYMAGLLNTPDQATLAGVLGLFTTGDMKFSFSASPGAGWIVIFNALNATIGSAASGAAVRANADTFALYQLIYTNCTDALAPVSGGRGASATADFNANKTITIPSPVGRAIIGYGNGDGVTVSSRVLGLRGGEEVHTLLINEMPQHRHQVFLIDPGHSHVYNQPGATGNTGGGGAFGNAPQTNATSVSLTGMRITSGDGIDNNTLTNGGNASHNNIQPFLALAAWIKL